MQSAKIWTKFHVIGTLKYIHNNENLGYPYINLNVLYVLYTELQVNIMFVVYHILNGIYKTNQTIVTMQNKENRFFAESFELNRSSCKNKTVPSLPCMVNKMN
jgi:hypothetical protein